MINKKYLKNLRCKEINNKNDFIFDCYSESIMDSLEIIRLDFQNILILGDESGLIYEFVSKKYKKSYIKVYDFKNTNFKKIKESIYDIDLLEILENKYDLILSNIILSLSNDFENLLQKIIKSLLPNGFFIATIPSPDNFFSLKSAMIQTDIEVYGGAYNRFNKSIELQQMITILKKNNFRNSSVNLEKIKLE